MCMVKISNKHIYKRFNNIISTYIIYVKIIAVTYIHTCMHIYIYNFCNNTNIEFRRHNCRVVAWSSGSTHTPCKGP